MNIELCYRFTPNVDVLDLLRGDVLALCQLEDVFLPVNDLQCTILEKRRGEVKQKDDERRKQDKKSSCKHIIT